MLTADHVRRLLDYNPETGVFCWAVQRSCNVAGSVAGTPRNGYIYIKIGGRNYLAHRLAWFYVHGVWPVEMIDHKNRDGVDNRILNLREATSTQNQANKGVTRRSKSGVKGVYRRSDDRAWVARIVVDRRHKHLGSFQNIDDAGNAYQAAAKSIHGDFAFSQACI